MSTQAPVDTLVGRFERRLANAGIDVSRAAVAWLAASFDTDTGPGGPHDRMLAHQAHRCELYATSNPQMTAQLIALQDRYGDQWKQVANTRGHHLLTQ